MTSTSRSLVVALAAQGAVCSLLAACSLLPAPARSDLDVTVENGTTLALGIRVNGAQQGVVAPSGGAVLHAAALGPLPWHVEAITPAGSILRTMTVTADMGCTTNPDGSGSCRGAGARADLVCGRFSMYAGAPMLGPAPVPGQGEPCGP